MISLFSSNILVILLSKIAFTFENFDSGIETNALLLNNMLHNSSLFCSLNNIFDIIQSYSI